MCIKVTCDAVFGKASGETGRRLRYALANASISYHSHALSQRQNLTSVSNEQTILLEFGFRGKKREDQPLLEISPQINEV